MMLLQGTLEYVDGQCCPVCKPRSICSPHSVTKTVKVGDEDECVSVGKIEVTSCKGTCGSGATAMFVVPYIETDCKCCKPTSMEKKKASFLCKF